MTLPKLEGKITIAAGNIITIQEFGGAAGPEAVTLTTGDFFWSTLDADDTMLDSIADDLTDNAVLGGTYALALDDSTGKITISASGGGVTSFTITWTSTAIRDLLGFAPGDTVSGALTYTGSEQAEYLWLPNVVRANPTAPDGDLGHEISDFTITFAPSGHTKRLAFTRRFVGNLEFRHVVASKMFITHETTANSSLQKFWRDVISLGKDVRYYKDRATDNTFVDLVIVDGGTFNPTPLNEGWEGAASLWSWGSEVVEAK